MTAARVLAWTVAAALASSFGALAAQEHPHRPTGAATEEFDDRLFGDPYGGRSRLQEHGVSLDVDYTFEIMSNVSGGVRRATERLGNLDVVLTAELEQLVGWRGARILAYGLGNHGGNPSENVGDAQITSNIEAPETLKLYELWVEQDLGERASVLVGLFDLNAEFDVTGTGELFLHSSHGIGAEFGGSGRAGPSVFPTTSLGARLYAAPTESIYARAVVLDGVPGAPDDPDGTHVTLRRGDGVLITGEVGILHNPAAEPQTVQSDLGEELPAAERRFGYYGKYAVGAWGYTGDFDDFARVDANGNPVQRTGSSGVYAIAEQCIHHEKRSPDQGLSVFARAGIADARVNTIDGYIGAGAVYRGLLPGRGEDRLGLAVAAAHFGGEFQRSVAGGGPWRDWEVAFEATYRAQLTPWFTLQPDLQLVVNPGGDPTLRDAWVLGVRGVVVF